MKLLLPLLALVAPALAVAADTPISTPGDLCGVATNLTGSFKLTADIDLSDGDWTPIGNDAAPFAGAFHGNDRKITGLRIGSGGDYAGLFGAVSNAVLDGVTLDGASITACGRYTGVLAGDVRGASVLRDCTVGGAVTNVGSYAGGLVGTASETFLTNCHANCTVNHSRPPDISPNIPTSANVGGLAGAIGDGTILVGCSAAGSVTTDDKNAGGLVGKGEGSFRIRDCVSSAEVVADEYTGGFIGYIGGHNAEISGCRADGYAGGAGNVGGFVGCIGGTGNVTVTNCAARGDVRATYTNYGGFIGWANDPCATNVNCWSSGAVWGKGGNAGAFVGLSLRGTNLYCGVSAYGPGPRYFSGSQTNYPFASLTAADLAALTNGWPKVKKHTRGATPISTAEELRAVANDPSGCYVLTEDIELDGQPFEPIGNVETPFAGEFYGQHHKITGFVVNTTNRYAGLFGVIAGGRVNGVRVDEGDVTGSYQGTSLDTGAGGFAGKITSKSMVDDCSFMGTVKNRMGGNIGGFVGRTDDSPAILRCCARDIGVENGSRLPNTGGFVGNHAYGYIVDAYAVAGDTVSSDGNYVGGFAGFVGPSARIATSWCNGLVSSSGQYVGAFVGDVNGGDLVTDSYYSTYPNGEDMKAKGTGGVGIGSSTAYSGITPLDDDGMGLQSSFQGFAFGPIWMMDEQAATPAPTLRTIFSECELWLKDLGIPDEYDPDEDLNGIPAIVRYVFGIDPGVGPDKLDEPLLDIRFDTNGVPYAKIPALVNTNGVTVEVLATETPGDWSAGGLVPTDLSPDGTGRTADGRARDALFFRWRIGVTDD